MKIKKRTRRSKEIIKGKDDAVKEVI
jgi:hypothetical protein